MRIIAGKYRGRPLAALGKGDAAAHLRPTSDRVRESLFSMLTHHDVIENARVLDLFAGTGALGFEALSRGAQSVCFVENGRTGQKLIAENIAKLQTEADSKLLRQDATKLGPNPQAAFNLVFMDPPYGKSLGQMALAAVASGNWLAPEALIVWEESTPMRAPDGFTKVDTRKYGDTHVTLLRNTPS
jgi:16S rRNA (guanine966-N2)-methyltransferase